MGRRGGNKGRGRGPEKPDPEEQPCGRGDVRGKFSEVYRRDARGHPDDAQRKPRLRLHPGESPSGQDDEDPDPNAQADDSLLCQDLEVVVVRVGFLAGQVILDAAAESRRVESFPGVVRGVRFQSRAPKPVFCGETEADGGSRRYRTDIPLGSKASLTRSVRGTGGLPRMCIELRRAAAMMPTTSAVRTRMRFARRTSP